MQDREREGATEITEEMEKDTVVEEQEDEAVQSGGEESEPDIPGDVESGEPGEEKTLLKQLEGEKARAEEYFNRLTRMQADFDNYRKRVAKEREDLVKYASEQLIKALLPILDNLDRALAVRHDDVEKVYEGVEMIGRQIGDILTAEGLDIIPAVGEEFNPEVHEAVMREEGSDRPENTVIEELRKGYTLRGKVIRAAMVKVAT